MKLLRISRIDHEPIPTATPIEGWTGGEVSRTRQPLLPDGASEFFSSSVGGKSISARERRLAGIATTPTRFW